MGEEGWPHWRPPSKAADSLAFGESFPNELSSVTRRPDFQGQVSATTQRPSTDPPHLGSRGCGVAVLETFMTLVAISSDPGATCLSAASPNVSWPGAFSPGAHPLCCSGGPSCSTRPATRSCSDWTLSLPTCPPPRPPPIPGFPPPPPRPPLADDKSGTFPKVLGSQTDLSLGCARQIPPPGLEFHTALDKCSVFPRELICPGLSLLDDCCLCPLCLPSPFPGEPPFQAISRPAGSVSQHISA